jgi:hypothetical protein
MRKPREEEVITDAEIDEIFAMSRAEVERELRAFGVDPDEMAARIARHLASRGGAETAPPPVDAPPTGAGAVEQAPARGGRRTLEALREYGDLMAFTGVWAGALAVTLAACARTGGYLGNVRLVPVTACVLTIVGLARWAASRRNVWAARWPGTVHLGTHVIYIALISLVCGYAGGFDFLPGPLLYVLAIANISVSLGSRSALALTIEASVLYLAAGYFGTDGVIRRSTWGQIALVSGVWFVIAVYTAAVATVARRCARRIIGDLTTDSDGVRTRVTRTLDALSDSLSDVAEAAARLRLCHAHRLPDAVIAELERIETLAHGARIEASATTAPSRQARAELNLRERLERHLHIDACVETAKEEFTRHMHERWDELETQVAARLRSTTVNC